MSLKSGELRKNGIKRHEGGGKLRVCLIDEAKASFIVKLYHPYPIFYLGFSIKNGRETAKNPLKKLRIGSLFSYKKTKRLAFREP